MPNQRRKAAAKPKTRRKPDGLRGRAEKRYAEIYEEAWATRCEHNPEWRGLLLQLCLVELEQESLDKKMDDIEAKGVEDSWFAEQPNGAIGLHPGRAHQKTLRNQQRQLCAALGLVYSLKGNQQTKKSKQAEIAEQDDEDEDE